MGKYGRGGWEFQFRAIWMGVCAGMAERFGAADGLTFAEQIRAGFEKIQLLRREPEVISTLKEPEAFGFYKGRR